MLVGLMGVPIFLLSRSMGKEESIEGTAFSIKRSVRFYGLEGCLSKDFIKTLTVSGACT